MVPLLVAGLAAFGGMRHNRLLKAEPAVDTTVSVAPTRVRLWFKEPAELAVSSIKVTGADGTPVATSAVQVADSATSIAVAFRAPVRPGAYQVSWKTASSDGHVIRGSYGFFVVRP
jgi:methionine-rich copper-binding protein CopC